MLARRGRPWLSTSRTFFAERRDPACENISGFGRLTFRRVWTGRLAESLFRRHCAPRWRTSRTAQRERVYQDFEHADLLADEPGQLAIRSVFEEHARSSRQSSAWTATKPGALAALMEDEDSFRKALAARLADRLRTGRSWSGFLVGTEFGRRQQPTAGRSGWLRSGRSIHLQEAGRKRPQAQHRQVRARQPERRERITQYTVFVEGLPQASNEFEADRLVPRARRPVFEAALCHDPGLGTHRRGLQRRSRSPVGHRPRIRTPSSRVGERSEAVRLRSVFLDGLKSRMPFAERSKRRRAARGRYPAAPPRCGRGLWADHAGGGK